MRELTPGIEVRIHHTHEDDAVQLALDTTAQLLTEAQEHAWACAVTGAELTPLEVLGMQAVQAFDAHFLSRYIGLLPKENA